MKCGSCILWQRNNKVCPIFNEAFSGDQEGCPKHISILRNCAICGNLILDKYIYDISTSSFICSKCSHALNSCRTCKESSVCHFDQDSSCPYPPLITKTIQQGNMQMMTQVRNPERERETCEAKCNCWNPKQKCCSRENNWCPSYYNILEGKNND